MASDRLAKLAAIARELGAEELARDAESVAARVAANRFYVACVGQFKRGKSTLINALIEEDLLPTGVVPVTAVITIVRFGADVHCVVHFQDGERRTIDRNAIAEFVTEEHNPSNEKRVSVLEIETTATLLASGMCLVDTPGLGSVFLSNTETTRAFVPHIDAAIVVIGADPPISGDEVALAHDITQQVRDVIFVLNKADRSAAGDVEQARAFAERAVREDVLTISALHRSGDWSKLRQRLAALAPGELAGAAELRASRRLAALLAHEIDERRRALTAPIEETERRLADVDGRITAARNALDDLTFLFASEQQKLTRALSEKRDEFLSQDFARANDERDARSIARATIELWLSDVEPVAQAMFDAATDRFVALLRDLGGIELERHLARRRFFFTNLSELTGRSFFHRRDAQEYLRRLLQTNSARVMNDMIDRFVGIRRVLERDVAAALREIGAASQRAANHARDALTQGRDRGAAQMENLERLRRELHDAPSV